MVDSEGVRPYFSTTYQPFTNPSNLLSFKLRFMSSSFKLDKLLDEFPGKLRFFDFFLLSGDQITLETGPSSWKAASEPFPSRPSDRVLFFDSAHSAGPFNRIDLKTEFESVSSVEELDLDKFDIDFGNADNVTTPSIANCVFESKSGKCLQCDSNYQLDWAVNACSRCPRMYLGFLGRCLDYSLLGPSDTSLPSNPQSKPLSKTSSSYSVKYQTATVTREFEYISYLTSPTFEFNESFSEVFIENPPSDSVSIYQLTLDYVLNSTLTDFPRTLYFNQIFKNDSAFYYFKTEVFEFNSDTQEIVLSGIVLNRASNSFSNKLNLFLVRKVRDEAGNVKKSTVDATNPREEFVNLKLETVDSLINTHSLGSDFIVPMRANPFYQPSKVFSSYSLFFYKMMDSSQVPDGKFLSIQGDMSVFADCSSHCKTCSSAVDCSECFDGFFLVGSSCQECSQECASCVDHRSKCKVCADPSKALTGGIAIDNCNYNFDSNCQNFVEGMCFRCRPGYSLGLSGCIQCPEAHFFDRATQTCRECITGCKNCSNGFSCDLCFPEFDFLSGQCHFNPNCVEAYYFDTIIGLCAKCIPNCYRCHNATQCQECNLGFFVHNDLCHTCVPNCYRCEDATSCLECDRGYFWKLDKCQKAEDALVFRKTNNSQDPQQEELISLDSGSQSVPVESADLTGPPPNVPFGCMSVSKLGCQFCFPKYVFDVNVCKKCPENCLLCDLVENCLKCVYGSRLQRVGLHMRCVQSKVVKAPNNA